MKAEAKCLSSGLYNGQPVKIAAGSPSTFQVSYMKFKQINIYKEALNINLATNELGRTLTEEKDSGSTCFPSRWHQEKRKKKFS